MSFTEYGRNYNYKSSDTCSLNIINNWTCKEYVPNICSFSIGDNRKVIETYAKENSQAVNFTYKIRPNFYGKNSKYGKCYCEQWKVNVSGNIYLQGCKTGWDMNDVITQNISLAPNNKSNPKYTLSGSLVTQRKQFQFIFFTHLSSFGIYLDKIPNNKNDEVACSNNYEIIINDPPTDPFPTHPINNSYVYCSSQIGFYTRNFTWDDPEKWGWINGVDSIPEIYILEVYPNPRDTFPVEVNNENSYTPSLEEGEYKWRIGAKHKDNEPVFSEYQNFYVCAADKADPVDITSPMDKYVGENVTLSWNKPDKKSDCARDSDYKYQISITKDNEDPEIYDKNFDETSMELTNLLDGSYKCIIKTVAPIDELSNEVKLNFQVCTPRVPSAPTNLILSEASKTTCLGEDGEHEVTFFWNESYDKGQACTDNQDFKYKMEIFNSSAKVGEYNETKLNKRVYVPCISGNYMVRLYAINNHLVSDPFEYNFSLCEQVKPTPPVVQSIADVNYCRSTTEIAWSHNNEWGKSCDASTTNAFRITYTQDEKEPLKEPNVPDPEPGNENYSVNASLGKGNWKVSIEACLLYGDDELCSDPGEGTVEASMIPEPTSLTDTNDGNNITLSWSTDSNFNGCGNKDDFKYTLVYKTEEEEYNVTLNVEDVNSVTIDYYDAIEWRVFISSTYDNGTYTKFRSYSTSSDCKIKEPRWSNPNKALVNPIGDKVVFEGAMFEWTGVESFGIACEENRSDSGEILNYVRNDKGPRGYLIYVNGSEVLNVTSDMMTETHLNLSSYGKSTWKISFYNYNVTVNTPEETFCLANNPPDVNLTCNDGPYTGRILNWTTGSCKRNLNIFLFQKYFLFF